MTRLAIVTSHPIQYHAPWFRALAKEAGLDLEVLYCHQATPKEQSQAGFGVEFDWDQSLLDGYSSHFLRNVASEPSVARFAGLDTPELAKILPSYEAVLVSGWHYKSAWQAIRTCWRNKIPVMVRGDSHLHTQRSAVKRWAKELPYRWFIPRLSACLPVGKWSREYFLHYGAEPDRVFVVPHSVDSFFRPESSGGERGAAMRRSWGWDEDDIGFLFVGKFTNVKRPFDFISAVAKAWRRNPRIKGVMVGDGPLVRECRRAALDSGSPVQLAGFFNQSSIVDAYRASNVLVVPSEAETWALVANEAMNCQRPCLVSDRVGCGPDLILDGVTGFRYQLGDVNALASCMFECAQAPERLWTMGRFAQKHIANYGISAAVDGTMAALARVLIN